MDAKDHPIEELLQQARECRMSRAEFLKRAAALGLAVSSAGGLLAACGEEEAPSEPGKSPASEILRLHVKNDMSNLDPAFQPDRANEIIADPIFEGLVGFKPGTWEVVNKLAETLEASSDALTYHFTLKQGIPFHGGYGEVTAEDVKYSFERIAGLTTPDINSGFKGDWVALEEVRVLGTYEGEIRLKQRYVPLMRTTLPLYAGYVVSKKAVEERGDDYATQPIGTGPYEFSEWRPKQTIVLKKFADYGGASQEASTEWKEIQYFPIVDENATNIALKTGSVDSAEIGLSAISEFEKNDQFKVEKWQSLDYFWIGMNVTHPKLKDINVRRAIRAGIDVPEILAGAFDDRYTRATSIIPPSMGLGYWEDAPVYERSVDEARSFMSKAGLSSLDLELKTDPLNNSSEVTQLVQAQLKDIGINVKIKSVDPAEYVAGDPDEVKSRELFYGAYSSSPDPTWSFVWFTGLYTGQNGAWNWMSWTDPDWDRLAREADQETDVERRNAMFIRMQEMWDEACHSVWLAWPTRYFGTRVGLQVGMRPDGWPVPTAYMQQSG